MPAKVVDNSEFCGKILSICKDNAEAKPMRWHFSERGPVQALCRMSVRHFQVARDDRDGCSRYRAAKIPVPVN